MVMLRRRRGAAGNNISYWHACSVSNKREPAVRYANVRIYKTYKGSSLPNAPNSVRLRPVARLTLVFCAKPSLAVNFVDIIIAGTADQNIDVTMKIQTTASRSLIR